MEAGSWRRFPASFQQSAFCGGYRVRDPGCCLLLIFLTVFAHERCCMVLFSPWDDVKILIWPVFPDIFNDGHHNLLCNAGDAQSGFAWSSPYCFYIPVSFNKLNLPIHWIISNPTILNEKSSQLYMSYIIFCERYEFMGLVAGYYSGRLYKTMKGKEWKVGQTENFLKLAFNFSFTGCSFSHGNPLPWNSLWHWLLCEPVHLGETLQRSDPFHNDACCCCNVVWHLLAACLPRILLRIQVWHRRQLFLVKVSNTSSMQEAAIWASC